MLLDIVLQDEGKVFFENQELRLPNVWKLRQKMAYVSQEMSID